MSEDHFLSRWSRLKKASAKATAGEASVAAQPTEAVPQAPPAAALPAAQAPNLVADGERPAALPPVESLTPESDFSPFMKAQVDETLKRRALKTLFQDPRFNVMDGLDVYIDDFSKADPLPDGWLEKMSQMAYLGDQGPKKEEEEEAAAASAETPAAIPEQAEGAVPLPQETLATAADTPSSDTPEASPVAPEVGQSQPEGQGLR